MDGWIREFGPKKCLSIYHHIPKIPVCHGLAVCFFVKHAQSYTADN